MNKQNRLAPVIAIVLIFAMIAPTMVSATSIEATYECAHYYGAATSVYEYEAIPGNHNEHNVSVYNKRVCQRCGDVMKEFAYAYTASHIYGSETGTGYHYHLYKHHYYETVKTCTVCKHSVYGEISYLCGGDGVKCPIIYL